jgi:hypothetical protein
MEESDDVYLMFSASNNAERFYQRVTSVTSR